MIADMSVFMGPSRLGSIRLANILPMNTDMSVFMGTHTHITDTFLL